MSSVFTSKARDTCVAAGMTYLQADDWIKRNLSVDSPNNRVEQACRELCYMEQHGRVPESALQAIITEQAGGQMTITDPGFTHGVSYPGATGVAAAGHMVGWYSDQSLRQWAIEMALRSNGVGGPTDNLIFIAQAIFDFVKTAPPSSAPPNSTGSRNPQP